MPPAEPRPAGQRVGCHCSRCRQSWWRGVAKAVEAIGQIEASSRKISDIIGVIDEIARQTICWR